MAWQTPKTNWKAGDVLSSEDFNRIEENAQHLQDTKETPQGAQAKADATLNSAKQYTDQKANATLNSAKQYTDQVANMIKPVIGGYTGTGSDININLGFRPKFVIISAVDWDIDREIMLFAFDGGHQVGLWWTDDVIVMGTWVEFKTTGIEIPSRYSKSGITYKYIAFR